MPIQHTPKAASALRLIQRVNAVWQSAYARKDWALTSRCRSVYDKLRERWLVGRVPLVEFDGRTVHFADPACCTCRVRLTK